MRIIRHPRKSYEAPWIKMLPLTGCTILKASVDKELPFDPDDGTEEALSPRNSNAWDDMNWDNIYEDEKEAPNAP